MDYSTANVKKYTNTATEVVKKELIRKFIHLSIALTPLLAELHFKGTILLLSAGTLVYALFEYMRHSGRKIPVITEITEIASRERDQGHFVLGPITLGTGALLALLLFPPQAAYIAIYALAFGDGLSSLVGKAFGRIVIPFTHGKTFIGSATCFAAVFFSCLPFSRNLGLNMIIALVATLLEMLPLKDVDNVMIPIGTGLTATLLSTLM